MDTWIVYRSGWNSANQSSNGCPLRMAVAEVDAEDATEACKKAAKRVSCYNNQHFDAELKSAAEEREAKLNAEVRPL